MLTFGAFLSFETRHVSTPLVSLNAHDIPRVVTCQFERIMQSNIICLLRNPLNFLQTSLVRINLFCTQLLYSLYK